MLKLRGYLFIVALIQGLILDKVNKLEDFAPTYININKTLTGFVNVQTGLEVIGDGIVLFYGFLINED
jgi:hypothetical protein